MVSPAANPFMIALTVAVIALLLVALAEWLHARRVRAVAHLAFGAAGTPAPWARCAPIVRTMGAALLAFGAVLLLLFDPVEVEVTPSPRASRQLLVVLDVSPSMNLKDAGPASEKMMRGQWAGKVMQGVLDRIDMKDTRITMVAFYSRALPMLQDTTDKSLLSNMMSGLPLYTAFVPGKTDLQAGLTEAFRLAKGWAPRSTTLIIVSDGDLEAAPTVPRAPASIADTIVIGVGDPRTPTIISGHSSRQDEWTLKTIAAKLGGYYHEGNTRHLPTAVLDGLESIAPRVGANAGQREIGLWSAAIGAALTAFIGPLLQFLGVPRAYRTARVAQPVTVSLERSVA
jgi:Ca-activated chloride channel family protein